MLSQRQYLLAVLVGGGGVLLLVWYLYSRLEELSRAVSSSVRRPQGMGLHQRAVFQQVVPPSCLTVTWEDVAGLDHLVTLIKRQVIYPMKAGFLGKDGLSMPPKGVLLYGPPGCGKTLVAKAIAKDINAAFINFDVSSIKNKFVGETEKMTSALFSLAHLLQPAVIFVDEVDAFLGTRKDTDYGTESTMKAQFLSLWDGLTTDGGARVLVLAATNRKDAIDPAILRRLPLQFEFPIPDAEQRLEILSTTLRHSHLSPDVDLEYLAERCEGFSGSDLYEVCRYAAISRLVRQMDDSSAFSTPSLQLTSLGPLIMADFLEALDNARDVERVSRPPSHLYL